MMQYIRVCWRRKERKKKKKELHHLDSRVEQINVRRCNEIEQIEISSLRHTWTMG
jgi:endonuclease I